MVVFFYVPQQEQRTTDDDFCLIILVSNNLIVQKNTRIQDKFVQKEKDRQLFAIMFSAQQGSKYAGATMFV